MQPSKDIFSVHFFLLNEKRMSYSESWIPSASDVCAELLGGTLPGTALMVYIPHLYAFPLPCYQ